MIYVRGHRMKPTSVREFLEEAFRHVDLDWKNTSCTTQDICDHRSRSACREMPAKAQHALGWKPKTPSSTW